MPTRRHKRVRHGKQEKIFLLSPDAMKYMRLGIILPDMLGSVPYQWNNRTKRVEFDSSFERHTLWSVHNFFYTGYLSFVTVRLIQYAFILESPSSLRSIATFYVLTSYSIVQAGQYSLFRFYGSHHLWINNFLNFLEEIQRTQEHSLPKLHDGSKICAWFMPLATLVFLLDIWSCAFLPEAPFYVSSLTRDPSNLTRLQQFPLVSFQVYIWVHQWFTMFFYINTLVQYLTGLKNTLNILRFGAGKRTENLEFAPPLSEAVNEGTANFAKYYRKLDVLNCLSNQIWSTAHAILEVSLLLGIITACYGTVRLDADRVAHQVSIVVLLTGMVLVIWGIMGEMFEVSVDVLHSWRKMLRNPWFRRFHKSVNPVRVNIGQGLFFADRGIRLTLLAIITTNVSSLLLSTSAGSLKA